MSKDPVFHWWEDELIGEHIGSYGVIYPLGIRRTFHTIRVKKEDLINAIMRGKKKVYAGGRALNLDNLQKPIIIVQGHRLIWQSPYNTAAVNELKDRIPFEQRQWSPDNKTWIISANTGNLDILKDLARKHYGSEAYILSQAPPEEVLEDSIDTTNLYTILAVNEDASQDEIKHAFRAAAIKWHPDRNSHNMAGQYFILIHNAYKTLSDPVKRKKYDFARRMVYKLKPGAST